MSESDANGTEADIVARAGGYYRNARYLLVTIMLALGFWFAYDGFINWPNERERFASMSAREQAEAKKPHTDWDIGIQKGLAYLLIPGAPILLGLFLYRSRGEIRLTGSTLHAPGHPPVAFDQIRELDMTQWERKGIAYVGYKLPPAKAIATLKLDDFVYQRDAIDEIVKRVEAHLATAAQEQATEETP
jgi:hypothetical protein